MSIMEYWPIESPARTCQVLALEWLEKQTAKYLIIQAPVGCHAIDTPILMHSGQIKQVQDIEVGELLMGPDSAAREVLRLNRGTDKMYSIKPVKGEPFVVNKDHILSLITTNTFTASRKYNSIQCTGNEIVNITVGEYLEKSNNFKRHHKLYRPELIEFPDQTEPSIDPYIMGVYLGDGCSVNKPTNHMTAKLDEYNLTGLKSDVKFIPTDYKLGSKEVRLNILAGLIDSDGHFTKKCFDITLKSKQLIEDAAFVARSLGFCATVAIQTINTGPYTGNVYHRLIISGHTDQIPTRFPRKKATERQTPKRPTVTGFSVERVGVDDYYGFTVDKDHLYVMGDFTVTHNCGKSLIGYTYSRFVDDSHGNSYILTPQKILQQQYEDAFGDLGLVSLYGKANYTCKSRNTNCEIGSVMKKKCDNCPHQSTKAAAIKAPNTAFNYKLALLYLSMDPDQSGFDPRKLIVFDEAHVLEQQLVDFDSIAVTRQLADRLQVSMPHKWTDVLDAQEWVEDTYEPALKAVVDAGRDEAEELQQEFTLNTDQQKFLSEWLKLDTHLAEITYIKMLDQQDLYINRVLVHDYNVINFKSLTAVKAFGDVLRDKAERMLFMSATILDFDGYCRDLGIDPAEAAFLDLTSDFPADNRPVYYMPQMKMNAQWMKPENAASREAMQTALLQLLGMHDDESGIVHTASFKMAEWYVDFLSNHNIKHQVMHHNPSSGDKREDVIKAYQDRAETGKPTLLISPSITEGLDLYDDRGRFAIFAKIPFGFLGDQWIKRRMDLSGAWYQRQALIQVMQGCGRIVRSKEDIGSTYILDGAWQYLYSNNYSTVPTWWHEGYTAL